MRSRGMKFGLHRIKDLGDVLHVYHIAVGIENLDKSAHVGPLKLLGQIDEHADRSDGILERVGLVAHLDRKPESSHPYLIDAQFTMVTFALFIMQPGLVWACMVGCSRCSGFA